MKKIISVLGILSLAAIFILSSCKKKEEEQPPTNNPTTNTSSALMKATKDGSAWQATTVGATIMNGKIVVTGMTSTDTLTLSLEGDTVGTYGCYSSSLSAAAYGNGGTYDLITNQSQTGGQVIVTEINTTDSTVSGTFSFTVECIFNQTSAVFEDGVFTNIPFTSTLPGTPNNHMSVDVDGSTFTPTTITTSDYYGTLIMNGTTDGNEAIGVTVPDNSTAGTYSTSSFGSYRIQYNVDQSTYLSVDGGTITITENDVNNKHITGTFSGTASNTGGTITRVLTNGSFDVYY